MPSCEHVEALRRLRRFAEKLAATCLSKRSTALQAGEVTCKKQQIGPGVY